MKIISIRQKILDDTFYEAKDILLSLEDDYDLELTVTDKELRIILEEFYSYYERKDLLYMYKDQMINHLEDIAVTAIEFEHNIDLDFLLSYLKLFELLDSEISVIPPETRLVVKKIKQKIKRGQIVNEGKRYKKL